MIVSLAAFTAAQDLPLPQAGPPPSDGKGFVKPTVTIKPPAIAPATTKVDDAREAALKALELELIKEQTRLRVAEAAKHGDANALKQLIVMAGPVDAALMRAPKPPATIEGRVALIGLNGGEKVTKSLEQFFGAPLTPEREKQLLETVQTQLAGTSPKGMEAKVAGWWPEEGVMAVTLVPRG
jgi:hypothetical protein